MLEERHTSRSAALHPHAGKEVQMRQANTVRQVVQPHSGISLSDLSEVHDMFEASVDVGLFPQTADAAEVGVVHVGVHSEEALENCAHHVQGNTYKATSEHFGTWSCHRSHHHQQLSPPVTRSSQTGC